MAPLLNDLAPDVCTDPVAPEEIRPALFAVITEAPVLNVNFGATTVENPVAEVFVPLTIANAPKSKVAPFATVRVVIFEELKE